jgi:hypothetical protein
MSTPNHTTSPYICERFANVLEQANAQEDAEDMHEGGRFRAERHHKELEVNDESWQIWKIFLEILVTHEEIYLIWSCGIGLLELLELLELVHDLSAESDNEVEPPLRISRVPSTGSVTGKENGTRY